MHGRTHVQFRRLSTSAAFELVSHAVDAGVHCSLVKMFGEQICRIEYVLYLDKLNVAPHDFLLDPKFMSGYVADFAEPPPARNRLSSCGISEYSDL